MPTRSDLQRVFSEQARFAAGYSPLYARLFAIVGRWLSGEAADPVVDWLLAAASPRKAFDVTLLLMAAVHREILSGAAEARALAAFYPTAGGRLPDDADEPAFAAALRDLILERGDALAGFIGRADVQTNETGRGLVWLLPVAALGWPAVHLVELGASAGLNLVAEQRRYRFAAESDPGQTLWQWGDDPRQFTTLVEEGAPSLPDADGQLNVLSRAGGDLSPFRLRAAEDELTLASFIWGDQPARIERLREGIAALRAVEHSAAPVELRPLRLPDELPDFLRDVLPRELRAPVVLFNTTVTMYLEDRGASLRQAIDEWAAAQRVPVLWLQWEPAWDEPDAPQTMFPWTADYWPGDGRPSSTHRLAWVHPHGGRLRFAPGWAEFLRISMQS